jgi:hypothetical protein
MKKYLNQIGYAILIIRELMTSTAGKLDKNGYIYLSLNMISFYSNGYTGIESITFFYLFRLYTTTKKPKSNRSGYVYQWNIFKLNYNLNVKLNLNHFG